MFRSAARGRREIFENGFFFSFFRAALEAVSGVVPGGGEDRDRGLGRSAVRPPGVWARPRADRNGVTIESK